MLAVMLIALIGTTVETFAQTAPPCSPPPVSGHTMVPSGYDVGSDDAFRECYNKYKEVHFLIMNSPFGEYRKVTCTNDGDALPGAINIVSTVLTSSEFYAQRQQHRSSSDYVDIGESEDWD